MVGKGFLTFHNDVIVQMVCAASKLWCITNLQDQCQSTSAEYEERRWLSWLKLCRLSLPKGRSEGLPQTESTSEILNSFHGGHGEHFKVAQMFDWILASQQETLPPLVVELKWWIFLKKIAQTCLLWHQLVPIYSNCGRTVKTRINVPVWKQFSQLTD